MLPNYSSKDDWNFHSWLSRLVPLAFSLSGKSFAFPLTSHKKVYASMKVSKFIKNNIILNVGHFSEYCNFRCAFSFGFCGVFFFPFPSFFPSLCLSLGILKNRCGNTSAFMA